MCKDIIISLQAAYFLIELPCFEMANNAEKTAGIVGMAAAVFIFCLFCEELYEKWQNRRKRIQKNREIIRKLRFQSLGKEK